MGITKHRQRRERYASLSGIAARDAIEPDRRRKSPGLQLTPRGQIPIAPAAPPPHHPPAAISCLGAFRTPDAGARGQIIVAGVRKPFDDSSLRWLEINT